MKSPQAQREECEKRWPCDIHTAAEGFPPVRTTQAQAQRKRMLVSVASRHEDPLTDVAVQWPEAMPANVRPHVVAWALAQPVKASSGRRSAGREENPKFIIGERSTLIATQCCNRCSVQRGLGRVGLL